MTRAQRRTLLWIQEQQDLGRSVTLREIGSATGYSGLAVPSKIIARLVEMGYLTHRPKQARSYEVIRRIVPILEHYVWDDTTKSLKKMTAEVTDVAKGA